MIISGLAYTRKELMVSIITNKSYDIGLEDTFKPDWTFWWKKGGAENKSN